MSSSVHNVWVLSEGVLAFLQNVTMPKKSTAHVMFFPAKKDNTPHDMFSSTGEE